MKSKLNLPSYLIYKRLLKEGLQLITLENENFQAITMRYAWQIAEIIIHRDRKVTNKMRAFFRFTKYLVFLNKNNGSLYVVKYLKASLLAIQRAIAGTPVSSLREIEPDIRLPRLTKGIPSIIGSRDRRAILAGSKTVIQFYLSIFALYRVIDVPVIPKISTITEEFSGNLQFLQGSLGFYENKFRNLIRYPLVMKPAKLLFLETSSPSNQLFSWKSWGYDAFLIRKDPGMWALFRKWLELTNNESLFKILSSSLREVPISIPRTEYKEKATGKLFYNWQAVLSYLRAKGKDLVPIVTKDGFKLRMSAISSVGFYQPWGELANSFTSTLVHGLGVGGIRSNTLGRLAFKKEAAGKLRVFAMVDIWTQSIFKPLHDALFEILKTFPNDATFDQDAAFKRAIIKAKLSGHSYGFDLSAATDRLPIDLQEAILRGFIGNHLAALWRVILVERDYHVPENKFGIPESPLRYSVGQPMGALSSWAMLAVCHHAIVQYCFHLIGGTGWTRDYEVLGDDIVIFNKPLATKYVEVMALYGVGLNMAKSVISHGKEPTVEFAKRTSFKMSDVSPISFKMFLNQDSFAGRLATFDFLSSRIQSKYMSLLKTIMKQVRWDDRPLRNNFVILGVFSTQIRKGSFPFVWLLRKWSEIRVQIRLDKGLLTLANFNKSWFVNLLSRVWAKKKLEDVRPRSLWSSEESRLWFKLVLIKEILRKAIKAWEVDPEFITNRILVTSGLNSYKPMEGFLMLRIRKHPYKVIHDRVLETIDFLKQLTLELSIYKLDADELLDLLEKVETVSQILLISEKKKKVTKVREDNLKAIQFISKTMTGKFKSNIQNQRMLSWLALLEKFKEDDPDQFKYIWNCLNLMSKRSFPDYTIFIQDLIVRVIGKSYHWDQAFSALGILVRRRINSTWLDAYPELYW